MFSNDRSGRNYFNTVELDNNQNFNEVRDYDSSKLLKTILRPIPMVNARFMLIDLLSPFRAIYFPLAHQAGPGFEDLCVYLMIDFRLRQGAEMLYPAINTYRPLRFDREKGLDYRHTDVMSIDLKGIYDYLILPQQLRAPEKGLYRTERRGDELITMWDRARPSPMRPGGGNGPNPVLTVRRPFLRDIDLVGVINDNFGVDVTWQPYQYSSWVVKFITHIVNLGLGFIPVVGPLASVSFSVTLQAITDPDGFRDQNILHLSADIVAAVIEGGISVRRNLPRSHQGSGAMMVLVKGMPESEQKASDERGQISEQAVADEEKQPAYQDKAKNDR